MWDNLQMTVYNNLAATNRIVKSIVNQQQDPTKFQRNVGKVVVYLKTFEYESIDESPAYEVSNLPSQAENVTIKVNMFTVSLDNSSVVLVEQREVSCRNVKINRVNL